MRINKDLRGLERRIAESMVVVLDYLSRVQQGLEQGSWQYVCDKIPSLVDSLEGLSTVLGQEIQVVRHASRARPAAVTTAISHFGRHYHAGRSLYPLQRDYDAASARVLLSRVARDLQVTPPQGVSAEEADHAAEIIRAYAAGSFGA